MRFLATACKAAFSIASYTRRKQALRIAKSSSYCMNSSEPPKAFTKSIRQLTSTPNNRGKLTYQLRPGHRPCSSATANSQFEELVKQLKGHSHTDDCSELTEFLETAKPFLSASVVDSTVVVKSIVALAEKLQEDSGEKPQTQVFWKTYGSWREQLTADDVCAPPYSRFLRNNQPPESPSFMDVWNSAAKACLSDIAPSDLLTVLVAHQTLNLIPDPRLLSSVTDIVTPKLASFSASNLLDCLRAFRTPSVDRSMDDIEIHWIQPADNFMTFWCAAASARIHEFTFTQLWDLMQFFGDWKVAPKEQFLQRWYNVTLPMLKERISPKYIEEFLDWHAAFGRPPPEDILLWLVKQRHTISLSVLLVKLVSMKLKPSSAFAGFFKNVVAAAELEENSSDLSSILVSLSRLGCKPSDAVLSKWQALLLSSIEQQYARTSWGDNLDAARRFWSMTDALITYESLKITPRRAVLEAIYKYASENVGRLFEGFSPHCDEGVFRRGEIASAAFLFALVKLNCPLSDVEAAKKLCSAFEKISLFSGLQHLRDCLLSTLRERQRESDMSSNCG